MAFSQDFIIKLQMMLQGQQPVISQLKETEGAISRISGIKIKEIYSPEGVIQGREVLSTISATAGQVKQGKSIWDEYGLAIRRAFIVAPVWTAARNIMNEINTTLKEGIEHYLETEKAIHTLSMTLQQMGLQGELSVNSLIERFKTLSLEVGKPIGTITNIYSNVQRILGDTEKSYLATNNAIKLSMTTQGDAAKIAETLAFLYKFQGDSLKGVSTDAQKFEDISIMLYNTQAKTPGGIEKLITDVRSFAAVMNIADFGIENTIKLFKALESESITNAQVLKTGVMRIFTNIDEVSKAMRMDLTNMTPFQMLTTVLEKLGVAMRTGQLKEAGEVIKELFGGGASRSAGQLAGLAKDITQLQEALAGKGVTEGERYIYRKQFEDVTKEAQTQIDIFKVLKKEVGESFLIGLMGGRNMGETMKGVNGVMQEAVRIAGNYGTIWKGIIGYLSVGIPFITQKYQEQTERLNKSSDLNERIVLGLHKQLTVAQTIELLGELQNENGGKLDARQQRIVDLLKSQLVTETKVTEQKEKSVKLSTDDEILSKKRAATLEKIIKNELDILQIRGASHKFILEQQRALENQLYGYKDGNRELAYQLEMEKEITKEKLNQVNISSDTVKLYRVAKEYGAGIAQDLGKFMTGAISYAQLERYYPKAKEAFAQHFPERQEEIEAAQYFGMPFKGFGGGLGGGRFFGAPGGQVPIQEFNVTQLESLKEIVQRLKSSTSKGLSIGDIKIDFRPNIHASTKEEMIQKIKDALSDAIDNDPNIQQILSDKILEE